MDLDEPFVDLPLAVEAADFRESTDKYYVVLAAKIPGSAISFLNKARSHQTEFDFAWRAMDSAGHVAAALRDTLPVKLNPENYQQVLAGNFLYEGGIVLPPGDYKLKAVVRENESGKMGTFEEPLTLPKFAGARLAVSSVIVSNQMQSPGAAAAASGRRSNGLPKARWIPAAARSCRVSPACFAPIRISTPTWNRTRPNRTAKSASAGAVREQPLSRLRSRWSFFAVAPRCPRPDPFPASS